MLSILPSLILLFPAPAISQTVVTTIHLNNVPNVVCDEVWVQDGVDMHFTSTTADDCTIGSCLFGIGSGPDGVWLYPSRLVADFRQSYSITKVEVDITDFCGVGCTRAFLYSSGMKVGQTSNTTVGTPEVLTVVPAGGVADMFAVSSCEGQVLGSTIRIYSTVVGTEDSSWSTLKMNFR